MGRWDYKLETKYEGRITLEDDISRTILENEYMMDDEKRITNKENKDSSKERLVKT